MNQEELEYLDSDLKYSVPQVKPKTRSITYDGADTSHWLGSGRHNHTEEVFYDGLTTPNPTEATPGDTITINCIGKYPGASIYFTVGWTSSATILSNKSDLNNLVDFPGGATNKQYSFIMPNDDIIVWCLCSGSTHTATPE